jgi:predicted secreted protein
MREFTDPERVEVETGEPFVIVLSHNFEGPYLWTAADVPAEIHVEREDNLAPGEGAPGASGEKVFELEATEPGTFTLHFERRFEQGEPKVDRERSVVVEAH